MPGAPFFPPAASTVASRVDQLFFFLLVSISLIVLVIFSAMTFFLIKYRRRPGNEIARRVSGTTPIELTWTLLPLGLSMIPFAWGATLYLDMAQPPSNSREIYVVAKEWMWKAEHLEGQSEINELHVPIGQPVKLNMISQDVIHSLFVPEFRVKADVLPGRYTTAWFQATEPGEYHLFCAEYCGLDHSQMIGRVVAMQPAEFQSWLTIGATGSPAAEGRKLFEQYGCAACHEANRGPILAGVSGRRVQLADGSINTADESYLRESIVNPSAKVVFGYQPIMPSFANELDDEQLIKLIVYIKSVGGTPGSQAGAQFPSSPALLARGSTL